MAEYERVREEAVRITKDILDLPLGEYSLVQCADIIADRILSIEGICIKADDQSYPEIPRKDIVHIIMERDTMLHKAGFVKVVKEEQSGFTEEELADLSHDASDDTIG